MKTNRTHHRTNHTRRTGAFLAAGLLGFTAFYACAPLTLRAAAESDAAEGSAAQSNAAANDAAQTEGFTEVYQDGEFMDTQLSVSDVILPARADYEVTYLGLLTVLPESLQALMEDQKVAMMLNDSFSQTSTLQYGYLSWDVLTEEQWNTTFDITTVDLAEWERGLDRAGLVGVYQAELEDQLDELTGCDEHTKVGESADGSYLYYLSTNSKADTELTDAIKEVAVTVTEMETYDDFEEEEPASTASQTSLGEFSTQDINGETYTQELFRDYDLTMVNVFATWCSPCVAEIPDLEKLHQAMADRGVGVVGVVLDVLDTNGEIVPESREKAKLLAERTGATYPFLIPDASYFNGRLIGIEAVPETFFVDKDGNIVGQTYSGSGSLEDWTAVVEEELANLEGQG